MFSLRFANLARRLALTTTFAASGTTLAGPSDPLKVALVVSVDPMAINVPTIELFRAVQDSAQEVSGFRTGSTLDIKQQLKAPSLAILGTIPAFDRKDFLKAKANKPARAKGKKAKKQVIRPVQEMLDTLALDGAVIVDCAPNGTATVKKCGLYYYDRSLGRVLAATSKNFRVGVADASRWAPSLLQSLSQGLTAYETNLERDRLKQVIAESNTEEEEARFAAEIKMQGTSLGEPTRQVQALPGAAVLLGRQSKGYSNGLELGYGKASAEGEEAHVDLVEKFVGLFFSVESKALESMLWDLGLGVDYAQLTAESASLDDSEKESGKLDARMIKLRFSPGMLWQVGKNLQVGAGLGYERLVPLSEASDGIYQGSSFAKNSLGFGIRLRTVF